jgi:hypothetical protein
LATAAVFLGHATKPDILFDMDYALIGLATIPSFLLISGFFTTFALYRGGRFLKKVAKRYYNMLAMFIPAAFLIFFMDLYTISVSAPVVATFKFDPDLSLSRILIDIFNLLTFSGEYWSLSTVGQGVFSNQAIWIIDYIMAYTVMTAALYLLTGWTRIITFVAAIAIAGIPVLLIAPLWFGGVLVFELTRRAFENDGIQPNTMHPIKLAARLGIDLSLTNAKRVAIVVMMTAGLLSLWIELSNTGSELYATSKTFASFEYRQYLGMSKRFLWQWSHVPSAFMVLYAGRIIFDGEVSDRILKPIQIASQYCFPVFAIHFSTMYFIQALMPGYVPRHNSLDPYVMMLSTFVISVAFGYLYFRCVRPFTDALSRKLFE